MKNFKNDWSIKNPKFDLSKDIIRNTIRKVFKKYDFRHIFGTPIDWDFDSYNIDVEINNANVKYINDENFKKCIHEVVNQLIIISNRQIAYFLYSKLNNYSEYNINIDYVSVILKLKISKTKNN